LYSCRHASISCIAAARDPNRWAFRLLGPKGSVERFDEGIRTHCQLRAHREVQEDVSGIFILYIHGWDESLNWLSIAVRPVFLPWLGFASS
jgi:hypothetical protein